MKKLLIVAAIGTLALGAGCKKKKTEGGGTTTSDKGGGDNKGGGDMPKLTADPDPGAITPADKPPFESAKLRMLDKRNTNGWPKYDLYNLGTKPIVFAAIYGYAYDKDGKQVARTNVPLSWNGKVEPGKKTEWDIALGGPDDKVPSSAVSYATCYNSIKFEGDANMTSDDKLCPEQMPKPQ